MILVDLCTVNDSHCYYILCPIKILFSCLPAQHLNPCKIPTHVYVISREDYFKQLLKINNRDCGTSLQGVP